jgi:hypothetical protein
MLQGRVAVARRPAPVDELYQLRRITFIRFRGNQLSGLTKDCMIEL